jgi:hypothetical protein
VLPIARVARGVVISAKSAFEAEMLTFPRGNASCGLSQAHDTGTGTDAATLIARTPESNADLVD